MKTLHSLPVVPAEPFAADALQQCESGACANCGLCCTTMQNTVPGVRGDVESAPVLKRAGEVCPQLVRTNRGRYMCALYRHVQAGDPRLADCAEWSGRGNGILQLTVQTEQWITGAPDTEAATMIADLVHRGLLAGFKREVTPAEAVRVARHYLRMGVVPREIFDLLDIRAVFRRMFRNEAAPYFQFDRELWTTAPDTYQAFFEDYVWDGSGPYARAAAQFDRSGP